MGVKKPLLFQGARNGALEFTQRDKVQYSVKYSTLNKGDKSEKTYFVTRWDIEKNEHISTVDVRRFQTVEEAKRFCQQLFDGTADLDELKAEIEVYSDMRQKAMADRHQNEADAFEAKLKELGILPADFVVLGKVWNNMSSDAQGIVYRNAKK